MTMLNIVLHEPEIPFNTGAIGRTCVATGSRLHLIRPYSFVLSDKYLKRAGMDYWEKLDLTEYLDFEEFIEKHPEIADERKSGKTSECAEAEASIMAGHSELKTENIFTGRDDADLAGEGNTGKFQEVQDKNGTLSFAKTVSTPRLWYATTKARQVYSEVHFGPDDYIMFGKESAGIPEEILVAHPERCIRIPMGYGIRSLNLSNSAAIVLYEALRQNDFPNLEREGQLHRLKW